MSWRLPIEAKGAVWSVAGYDPWPSGESLRFHEALSDPKVLAGLLAGGERSGKSCAVGRGELTPYLATPHPDRGYEYYIIADVYRDTRFEFTYAMDDLAKLGLLEFTQTPDSESSAWFLRTKTGNTLRTWTGRDPGTIRGWTADGIVLAEPGRMAWEVRRRAEGRLHDRDGWLIEAGTFEGSLHWYAEEWDLGQVPNAVGLKSFSMPSYVNREVYPLGEEDPKILRAKELYSTETFDEVIKAIPSKPSGIVIREFSHRLHIDETEYVRGGPVWVFVDPGFSNPCAVLAVQEVGGIVRVFDGFYRSGFSTYMVIDHLKTLPWWGDVTGGAIDQAAKAHVQSQPERKSDWDIWYEYGGVHLATNTVPVGVGIDRVRSFMRVDDVLKRPRLQVAPHLQGLICEMGGGPAPELEKGKTGPWLYKKRGDGTLSDEPEDKNNHALKALAYGLVWQFGVGPMARRKMRQFPGARQV